MRWDGLTLLKPFRTFLVSGKGAYLEILAGHVYHVIIQCWSRGRGFRWCARGLHQTPDAGIKFKWIDTCKNKSHLLLSLLNVV